MNALRATIIKVLAFLASFPLVRAHCPLCTAAIGTGMIAARFYGVDDTIAGVWIGAFVVSTALWADRALKKKYIPFQSSLLTVAALLATIVPFYFAGLIGNSNYAILGIDKLLLGIVLGSIATILAIFASGKVRKHDGKVLFPYQTIMFVIASLIIVSLICWGIVGTVR